MFLSLGFGFLSLLLVVCTREAQEYVAPSLTDVAMGIITDFPKKHLYLTTTILWYNKSSESSDFKERFVGPIKTIEQCVVPE